MRPVTHAVGKFQSAGAAYQVGRELSANEADSTLEKSKACQLDTSAGASTSRTETKLLSECLGRSKDGQVTIGWYEGA